MTLRLYPQLFFKLLKAQGGIMPSEAESIRYRCPELPLLGSVGYIVQRTVGVGSGIIYRRRNNAVVYR